MQIDNRAFYRKLRTLAAPITFQSFMLAAVAAADALMRSFIAEVNPSFADLIGDLELQCAIPTEHLYRRRLRGKLFWENGKM